MTFKQFVNKVRSYSPFPYYIEHLIVGCIISLIFWYPLAGAIFFLGRELRDWEKMGKFDHKGFWYPVIPLTILHFLLLFS